MFNFAETLAAARVAVNLRGENFRYGPTVNPELEGRGACNIGLCEYTTDDDAASCIVGWVFVILGLPLPNQNGSVIDSHIHQDRFSIKALAFLKAMQMLQDNNIAWGRALDLAAASVADYNDDGTPSNPPQSLDPSRLTFVKGNDDFEGVHERIDGGENILATMV